MALEHINSSLLIGRNHLHLKRVESTNDFAVDYLSKNNPIEGTVISASFQYKGKGQIGRSWESEDGKNVLCSTILKPTSLQATRQFSLNIAVSLAVMDFCRHYLAEVEPKVTIKWPNDIYVEDKKIAGILIQNSIKGKYIQTSVVGTGININQLDFSDYLPNPISLANILQKEISLDSAYSILFECLNHRIGQLYNGDVVQMKKDYLSNLYRIDEWHHYISNEASHFIAKITGIDEIGQLNMTKQDGSHQSYGFREISFVI